jgi:hypothetical protein
MDIEIPPHSLWQVLDDVLMLFIELNDGQEHVNAEGERIVRKQLRFQSPRRSSSDEKRGQLIVRKQTSRGSSSDEKRGQLIVRKQTRFRSHTGSGIDAERGRVIRSVQLVCIPPHGEYYPTYEAKADHPPEDEKVIIPITDEHLCCP